MKNTCDKKGMDEDFKKVVGLNIRSLRALKGISGDSLAEAIDFSSKQLYKVERGEVACSYEIIILIAKAMDVPINSLFEGINLSKQTEELRDIKIKLSEYLRVRDFIMKMADDL